MSNFKVGDRVRCVDGGAYCYLEKGKTYNVLAVDVEHFGKPGINVVNTTGYPATYDEILFDLVEAPVIPSTFRHYSLSDLMRKAEDYARFDTESLQAVIDVLNGLLKQREPAVKEPQVDRKIDV